MTRAYGALVAGGATAALVASAAALSWRPGSPVAPIDGAHLVDGTAPWFAGCVALAFAAYLVGLRLVSSGVSRRAVLAIATLVQGVAVAAPLLLSTDAWTYWGYGWIGAVAGGNPYADPPASFPDSPAAGYVGADWTDTTTVYGPAFTLASEPLARLVEGSADGAAWTYKALAAAAILAAAVLAARVASRPALALALVGWNPVLAIHLGGGGHNDAWLGALLTGALALAVAGRARLAGVTWAVAVLVKWVPLVFLALTLLAPSRNRRRPSLAAASLTVGVLAVVASLRYGLHWLGAIAPLARNAGRETSFAIPSRLEHLGLPDTVAVGLAGAALVVGLAYLARESRRGRPRLGLAACLVLVTTPYLAVWYLGWAIPLVAADDDDRVAVTAGLALTAYLLPQTIPL